MGLGRVSSAGLDLAQYVALPGHQHGAQDDGVDGGQSPVLEAAIERHPGQDQHCRQRDAAVHGEEHVDQGPAAPGAVLPVEGQREPIDQDHDRDGAQVGREGQRLPGDLGDLVEVIAVPVADDHRKSHDRGIAHDQRQREPVGTAEDAGRRRLGGRRTRARRHGYTLFQPYKPSAPPPARAP